MRPAHVLCDIRLQRAQSNYSVFKVREVFALTNQLGIFFRFVRSFFEIFQINFFDHLSGIKKAPITSQRCNRGRNRKSPLTEISGLKSYEIIVCYRNLSAIAKFQTHFWRKPQPDEGTPRTSCPQGLSRKARLVAIPNHSEISACYG